MELSVSCGSLADAAAAACPWSATAACPSVTNLVLMCPVDHVRGGEYQVYTLYGVDVLCGRMLAMAAAEARRERQYFNMSTAGGHAADRYLLLIAPCMLRDALEDDDTR